LFFFLEKKFAKAKKKIAPYKIFLKIFNAILQMLLNSPRQSNQVMPRLTGGVQTQKHSAKGKPFIAFRFSWKIL
jgi:hypothetical protein